MYIHGRASASLRCLERCPFLFYLSRVETGLQHSFKYPAHPTQIGWGKLDGGGGRGGRGDIFVSRSFDSWLKSIAQRWHLQERLDWGLEAFCCCSSADVVGATPEFLLYTHFIIGVTVEWVEDKCIPFFSSVYQLTQWALFLS